MKVSPDFSLQAYNTFGITAKASFFAEVASIDELKSLLADEHYRNLQKLVLGGGSNLLFTKNYNGLVIHNSIKGIRLVKEDSDHAWVKAGGGVIWHDFVLWCLDHNYAGIENLSLIPGSVGAAPIQNIGAYGVELKDTFFELEAVNLSTGELKVFNYNACMFGYRDSIFKREAKGKFIIVSVTLKLNRNQNINTSYGAIEDELKKMEVKERNIQAVSLAVINIRRSKLPDPAVIGNAGSFFKNPEIPLSQYESLKIKYPELVAYKTPSGNMKLAAGWMIEQCGWKGKVSGNVGMHAKQALVLVNYGKATGQELIEHAKKVQQSVNEKFGVFLEMEVNIV